MKSCQECHWFSEVNPTKVVCGNLGRTDWVPIEPENTCEEFVTTEDYVIPTGWTYLENVLNAVMVMMEAEDERREKDVKSNGH